MRTKHNQIHYVLGMFFMGLPMCAHILFIFLAPMSGSGLGVGANRPALPATPFIGFAGFDLFVFLSFDDIFRASLTLFCFIILFPISVSNWARNKVRSFCGCFSLCFISEKKHFTISHWIHIVAAALFSVDMIRRSGHSQIFNSPVVAYYLVDRIAGIFFYRTGVASVIHKEQLDEDYVVVFLYVPKQKRQRLIGSTYYLQVFFSKRKVVLCLRFFVQVQWPCWRI
jgi:hypothetical protein